LTLNIDAAEYSEGRLEGEEGEKERKGGTKGRSVF